MIEMTHLAGSIGANQQGTLKMLLKSIAYQYGRNAESQVSDAINKAQTSGIGLVTILAVLLPLVISLFSGQKIDLATIIAAILGLIVKK
jgi:hypothetical protein